MENIEIKQNTIELELKEITEMININTICRLCANQNDKLIGIYNDEGITNDLSNRLNSYLPIKVTEADELPLQCCWNCVSIILTWHNFVLATVEADQRLRSLQFVAEKEFMTTIDYHNPENSTDGGQNKEILGPQPITTSLNAFCQTENTTYDEDKNKLRKPVRRKKKTELVNYFTNSEGTTNTFDNYITDIQNEFITQPEETELNNQISDDLILSDEETDDGKNMKTLIEDNHTYENSEEEDEDVEEEDEEELPNAIKSDKVINEQSYHFGCPYCPTVYLSEKDVLKHIQKDHPGYESKAIPITDNNTQKHKKDKRKNTKIDQDLISAAKVVVDGRIYYNCKECGKSLHSPYTYIWHMRIHTGERPFVCDLCGKQFRVSQGLVRHLRETHEGIKNFSCDLCGRMFATRRNVEEHRRIHTNERPYICDLCGKSFKQKASLFVHNRSHNNLFPFKCSYCNQSFRTKPPLLIHITRHTGEKPYKCDICGRCFRIKYELKRHRLIHSDEKPFSCDLCGLSFRQKRYLRNHNKSNHTLVSTN